MMMIPSPSSMIGSEIILKGVKIFPLGFNSPIKNLHMDFPLLSAAIE
jgi:hypothetical protein